jgi:7,8-dihydroneopterin aldolase/epimerase/oxygenase
VTHSDRVHGLGFSFECRIGFHEYERHIRQRVLIDFEAETNWRAAAHADRPIGLVNYYEVNRRIQELVDGGTWNLIEALADRVARLICADFPVSRVRVKVTKVPFDMPNTRAVAVECWRTPQDFGLQERTA